MWQKELCRCDYSKDFEMGRGGGDYLELSAWAQFSHKGPYKWKWEAGVSQSDRYGMRKTYTTLAGFDDRKRSQTKEHEQSLEAGKDMEMEFFLESPEEM